MDEIEYELERLCPSSREQPQSVFLDKLTARRKREKERQRWSPRSFDYDHSSKRVLKDTARRSLDSVLGTALVVLLEIGESLRVAREAQEREYQSRTGILTWDHARAMCQLPISFS